MGKKKRASLDFDAQDQIDIEELTGIGQNTPLSEKDHQALLKAGEENGFVSRKSKTMSKRRGGRPKYSPYTNQFGGRCRKGMKELFRDIAIRLDIYDNETLERAILALIEKEDFHDLKEKYMELVK